VEEKDEMVAAQLQRAAASDAANIGRSGAGQQLGFMVGGEWGKPQESNRGGGDVDHLKAEQIHTTPAPEVVKSGRGRAAPPHGRGGRKRGEREDGDHVRMCEEGERESGGRFGLDPTDSGLLGQAWLARLLGQPNRSFDLFYFLNFILKHLKKIKRNQ
jgi:hypothetical protein